MIAHIRGKVVEVHPMSVIVDVGGIGYRIAVTSSTGLVAGEEALLYTHLAIRENAHDLYGFTNRDELSMFEELIKLPKIGPKTALQILSQADLATLRRAVETDDPAYLSKMSGIGRKSAEKIVLGLKDVLGSIATTESTRNQEDSDILDALVALGYSQRDALQAVQKVPADITDTNARIKYALKSIGS